MDLKDTFKTNQLEENIEVNVYHFLLINGFLNILTRKHSTILN